MLRLVLPATLLVTSSACIAIRTDGPHYAHSSSAAVYQVAPFISDGQALCVYNTTYGSDDVELTAWVGDDNGQADIVSVWADFYGPSGQTLLASTPLYPSASPGQWYAVIPALDMGVDCWAQGYSVDLYVYDNADLYDAIGVWVAPYSYGAGYP